MAFDLRKLIIAALGVVLLQLGWSLCDGLFAGSSPVTPGVYDSVASRGPETGADWTWETVASLHFRLWEPVGVLTTPLFTLIEPLRSWGTMLHAVLSLVWLLVVWGICGGAICRIAIVQVAELRQTGVSNALRFAIKSSGKLIVAPLCPLLGVAFCAAVTGAFGLLYRLPAIGGAFAGAVLVVPLAMGLVMTLLVAGLVAGWPLMHAAVAAGVEDALDALSRTFGYLNQRIGALAVLLAVLWLEGLIGLQLVDLLAGGVIRLTHWGLGLTAPQDRLAILFGAAGALPGAAAAVAHAFWLGVVRLLAHSWIYSFYWTAAALVYLWLRHDVDGTPWDEIEPDERPSTAAPSSIVGAPNTGDSPSTPPTSE